MQQGFVQANTREIGDDAGTHRGHVRGHDRIVGDDQDRTDQGRGEGGRSSVDSEGAGELRPVLRVGGREPALRDRRTLHRDRQDPGSDL